MTERLKRAIQKCSLAVTESEQFEAMEAVNEALQEILEADRRVTIAKCAEVASQCGEITQVWDAFQSLLLEG